MNNPLSFSPAPKRPRPRYDSEAQIVTEIDVTLVNMSIARSQACDLHSQADRSAYPQPLRDMAERKLNEVARLETKLKRLKTKLAEFRTQPLAFCADKSIPQ